MIEISLEYWNKLANQIILICSLLTGFTIAVIANIVVSKIESKIVNRILRFATLAACLFLISMFGMTKILMMTTEGFPFEVSNDKITFPRIISTLSFFFGIISLLVVIALSGFTKSKKLGRFTLIVGILTLILILWMAI
ncbi:hypothetical protein [Aureivirga sp. CE67]|uniref:hypothetical protein n=1 Tax=Aureivirga sp. CE67 TaxID=1788983 RepID=UPI0018CB0365|nr:hypothetical protein [Aureivirga sp. CE67]